MRKNVISIVIYCLVLFSFLHGQVPNAWINEIHYDNLSTDANEAIEVAVPSTYTDLVNFSVTLYNGSGGAAYGTKTLDSFTAGNTNNGFTFYYYTYPSNGIQNGAPDGIALSYSGSLIQFLSYEGTLTAVDGAANGVTSIDIGVFQDGTGATGLSLQLGGSGNVYSNFTWQSEDTWTFGTVNNNQTILAAGSDIPPVITGITIDPILPSGVDAVSVSATVTDDNAVSTVVLTWGTNGTTYPNSISMTITTGDIYQTSSAIPAQAAGTTVYFVIKATDDASQTSTSSQQSYQIPETVTIFAIQSGTVTLGSLVRISGIVTAGTGEVSDGTSSFYLQDGTGQYSGINIYSFNYTVARGDNVTLVGEYAEYDGKSEIENITNLVVNSAGNEPPAAQVLTLNQSDWEPWEGVLVKIENVTVSLVDAGFGEWEVSDGTNNMRIDNSTSGHYSYVPVLDDQFISITGPLNYTHLAYKIIPRDDDDLDIYIDLTIPVADAGGDQQVDFGALVTLDGTGSTDSDGTIVGYLWEKLEGPAVTLSDYEEAVVTFTAPSEFATFVFQLTVFDNDAQSATDEVTIKVGSLSIYDIQYADQAGSGPSDCYPSTLLNQTVTVTGIVTAVKPGTYPNFFLQQPDATSWGGILVYDTSVNPAVGDEVTVTATVTEYNGLSELKTVTSFTINSNGNSIDPVAINSGDLGISCSATGEQYEGMLVELMNVTVDSVNQYNSWYVNDGSGQAKIDDYYFNGVWVNPTAGVTYETIIGVVDYAYGEYMIYPLSTDDIVVLGGLDEPQVARNINLMSNYPNPFNPTTTISYQLEVSGKVRLDIYNLNGQLVNTLVNDFRNGSEMYSVIWDGKDSNGQFLSSGIYFTRLTSENLSLTNKITLLK
ncbi:MAG: T9SS type A sorting domain-containing protein [Candidatus Neomarinimicrobiota bacterium]